MRRRISLLLSAAVMASGCARYEPRPITRANVEAALSTPDLSYLQAKAQQLSKRPIASIPLDPKRGLTPDSAAILAVLLNPSLRADRNRLSLAAAQVLQAGLLPNPQLTANNDFVTSGPGVVNPFGVGVSWDITSLLAHDAKVRAAAASQASIRLDVAWTEWQTAMAARIALLDEVALERQLAYAKQVDERLADNRKLVAAAVDRHEKTLLDLSAASTASLTAHADMLALQQQAAHQRQLLLRAIGLPPTTVLSVAPDAPLPLTVQVPALADLLEGLESRRLDLVALRRGYEAQEQSVRAAILQQFPKINVGVTRAEDNTGVHTIGVTAAIDLPIFDQNQGVIATEKATRQKLFDEYATRVFQARSDAAMLLEDIRSVMIQIAAAQAALPELRQLVEAYRLALQQRNADVLSYYTAQSDLDQKEISLLKLQQQLADDKVGLEIVCGLYLPQAAMPALTRPTGSVRQLPAWRGAADHGGLREATTSSIGKEIRQGGATTQATLRRQPRPRGVFGQSLAQVQR